MQFQHYDLGRVAAGKVVRITLADYAANVRLMDDLNFRRFERGESYSAIELRPSVSPYDVAVPHAGHWHVVIDQGQAGGWVNANVAVLA